MKFWIWILTLTLVTACAFDDNAGKNSENARDERERAELLENFSRVTGTWTGTLKDGTEVSAVELIIYHLETQRGTTSTGDIRTRPVLYGRLRTTDIVRFDVTLPAQFFAETGQLVFFSPSANGNSNGFAAAAEQTPGSSGGNPNTNTGIPGNVDEINSISGTLQGQRITGEVKTKTGVLGRLDVSLSTRETGGPSSGSQNELNERLYRMYRPLEGTYAGRVAQPFSSTEKPFGFRVVVFISLMQTPRGPMPTLMARQRVDFDTTGEIELTMKVDYKPETRPPQILLTSQNVTIRPGNYFVELNGHMEGNKITGLYSTQRGPMGNFTLQKIAEPARPTSPTTPSTPSRPPAPRRR